MRTAQHRGGVAYGHRRSALERIGIDFFGTGDNFTPTQAGGSGIATPNTWV